MAVIASTPRSRSLRGRLAVATRDGHDTTELKRDLAALMLEEHIRKVVDAAPPLKPEQRMRLAALLAGGGE